MRLNTYKRKLWCFEMHTSLLSVCCRRARCLDARFSAYAPLTIDSGHENGNAICDNTHHDTLLTITDKVSGRLKKHAGEGGGSTGGAAGTGARTDR